MRTVIKGRNLDVPDADREYLERKMARLERLLDDRSEASVELSREQHRDQDQAAIVEVLLVVDGRPVRAVGRAATHRAAADQVIDRLERQVVDLKERRDRATDRRVGGDPGAWVRDQRGAIDGAGRPPGREGQAVRHRADVRGGRGRPDGGAGPRLLRVRERRERADRRPVPTSRRRLRPHRADRRRLLLVGAAPRRRALTGGAPSSGSTGQSAIGRRR